MQRLFKLLVAGVEQLHRLVDERGGSVVHIVSQLVKLFGMVRGVRGHGGRQGPRRVGGVGRVGVAVVGLMRMFVHSKAS